MNTIINFVNHKLLYFLVIAILFGMLIYNSYKTQFQFLLGDKDTKTNYIHNKNMLLFISIPFMIYFYLNEKKCHEEKNKAACMIKTDRYGLLLLLLVNLLYSYYNLSKNKSNIKFIKYNFMGFGVALILIIYYGFYK